jgi:hypothetical protein
MGDRGWGRDPRARWTAALVTAAVLVGMAAMTVLPAGAAPAGGGGTTLAIGVATLSPLVALVAGILILLMPHLLNYIVAIYLIIAGLLGLGILGR